MKYKMKCEGCKKDITIERKGKSNGFSDSKEGTFLWGRRRWVCHVCMKEVIVLVHDEDYKKQSLRRLECDGLRHD